MERFTNESRRVILPISPDGGLKPNANIPAGYKTPTGHIRIIGFEKTLEGSTNWQGITVLEKK